MTVIRREDGREWRIEDSAEGVPLVFGDGKYDHDPPRVASRLESALAEQLQGAVMALREYGHHRAGCSGGIHGDTISCACGLSDAISVAGGQ